MNTVGEWLVSSGIARHGKQAGYIIDGLKLNSLPREEQEARAKIYRLWRPASEKDKKKLIPTYQAYQLAIYGLASGDVVERQVPMIVSEYEDDYFIHLSEMEAK